MLEIYINNNKTKPEVLWGYAFQPNASKAKINFSKHKRWETHQIFICPKFMKYHFSNARLSAASVLLNDLNHECCSSVTQLTVNGYIFTVKVNLFRNKHET